MSGEQQNAEIEQASSAELDAQFDSGYSGEPEKTTAETKAAETQPGETAKPEENAESQETGASDVQPDEWEGVPAVVRKRLEALESIPGAVNKLAGHIGGLSQAIPRIESTLKAAKAAAGDGRASPSMAQVKAALKNPEAWERFRNDFEDFAPPIEAELLAIREEMAGLAQGQTQQFDAGNLKTELMVGVQELIANTQAKARQFAQLDIKYEGWEEKIKTPEFQAFAWEGGPTAEERARIDAAEQSSPKDADGLRLQVAQKYPQWWAEKGVSIYSQRARDAARLLDAFEARQQSHAEDQNSTADAERLKKEKRLERAVAPKGTQQRVQSNESIDAAFDRGYRGDSG